MMEGRRRNQLHNLAQDLGSPDGYGARGCCATGCIAGFPPDRLYRGQEENLFMANELRERIDRLERNMVRGTRSISVATINTQQKKMEKVLRSVGYEGPKEWAYRSKTNSEAPGPRTGVKVFVKHLVPEEESYKPNRR